MFHHQSNTGCSIGFATGIINGNSGRIKSGIKYEKKCSFRVWLQGGLVNKISLLNSYHIEFLDVLGVEARRSA